MTLSWKLPDWPAILIVVWLPNTWALAIHTASGTTGFTLPGIILEPGWSAGKVTSPKPAKGPLFIQRRSLLIFIITVAKELTEPAVATAMSWPEMPVNRFLAVVKGCSVKALMRLLNCWAKSG